MKKIVDVKDLVVISVFVALLVVCSLIKIPVGTIPITLQTLGVCMIGGLLGIRKGLIAIFVYIIIGIIGIPVFAGFTAGITKFVPYTETGATGGYILGFFFTVIVIGVFKKWTEKHSSKTRKLVIMIAGMILGDALCFLFGTVWFVLFNPFHMGVMASIGACVIPFIIPDIIKIIVAGILVVRIDPILAKVLR